MYKVLHAYDHIMSGETMWLVGMRNIKRFLLFQLMDDQPRGLVVRASDY